jgi:hypothetical protein
MMNGKPAKYLVKVDMHLDNKLWNLDAEGETHV